jgi:hypothetical protein
MKDDLTMIAGRVSAALIERRLVPPGTTLVFVSISDDLSQQHSNYLKLHQVV